MLSTRHPLRGSRSITRQTRPSCFASIRCRRDVRRATQAPPRPTGRQEPGSQPDECPLHNVKQPANAGRPGTAQPAHAAQPKPDSPPHNRTIAAPKDHPPEPEWWSQTGSNRRPHACKARALPAELWPQRRRASQMVGLGRLELPTSRLSSARSNQLSYKPGTAPDPDHPAKTIPANTPGKRHAPRAKPPAGRENPPDQAARRRRAVREERETKTTKSRKRAPRSSDVLSDPKVEIRDRLSQARPRKGPSLERR
jgi:hypothetical protein